MIRNVRFALIALSCASALALAGCGSSFSCDTTSACSADPARTADEKAACQAELDGPCGSEYKALGQCAADHQTCTADNTTDPASLSACSSEAAAAATCEENHS